MKPYYEQDGITIYHGDCREVLPNLSGVDAVVTDPPYGLSFMGRKWDYDVPSEDVWRMVLEASKPGAHLLAFAGTRTQHRMAVRIEDAGWEVRDMLAWVYGSGFPKSLDVSKAVDKVDAAEMRRARQLRFTGWMRGTGMTARQIDDITGTFMGNHYTTHSSQPAVPTREMFEVLRPHLGCKVPEWVEELVNERTVESENYKRREVVGAARVPKGHAFAGAIHGGDGQNITVPLTKPATSAAAEWDGWGTALKPALEPITMARKPFSGTVAQNVLTHGTGALNLNECRVGSEPHVNNSSGVTGAGRMRDINRVDRGDGKTPDGRDLAKLIAYVEKSKQREPQTVEGRWPANLIHDGSDEVLALFPESEGMQRAVLRRGASTGTSIGGQGRSGEASPQQVEAGYGDTGSAARFFYTAKASRSEREAALETERSGSRKNDHPTVKPLALMRYLCTLITPPRGLILDPFMGSGSTLRAAKDLDFRAIGIELEERYCEIAAQRLSQGVLNFAEEVKS